MNRVMSQWDKISDIDVLGNGRVVSNYILQKRPGSRASMRPYEFGNLADFAKWKAENI